MLQLELGYKGPRYSHENAGRKPSRYSGISHLARPMLRPANPMLITQRVGKHIPNLREGDLGEAVFGAIEAGADRMDCKVVEFSIQSDHLHLMVEAQRGGDSLSRFMKGLNCRIAKAINRALGRSGRVFADRYHRSDKVSLREVYSALRYVLCNGNKHKATVPGQLDPLSSAPWSSAWKEGKRAPESTSPLPESSNWKMQNCVLHYGLLDPSYCPRE